MTLSCIKARVKKLLPRKWGPEIYRQRKINVSQSYLFGNSILAKDMQMRGGQLDAGTQKDESFLYRIHLVATENMAEQGCAP